MWPWNCFITLTYQDDELPELYPGGPPTLLKSDFQKFMKRFRKKYTGKTIRYYMVGEYGETTERPHYHACIFNHQFEDLELHSVREEIPLYTSDILKDIWQKGHVTVGDVNYQTAAYCARYTLKKVTGKMADEHYLRSDPDGVAYWLEPEYNAMSRRPGIGKQFYEAFKDDIYPSGEVPVPGQGVYKTVPRYYDALRELEDPEEMEAIKYERLRYRLANQEEYSRDRLESKYKVAMAKKSQLKRGLTK